MTPPVTVRDGDSVYLRCTTRDPAFLVRATARFTRTDNSRSTPGTGLGLTVVDAIVTAHRGGGRCRHREPGTTVTVLLPG